MLEPGSTHWCAMVRSMLFEGYGVEDIAVHSQSRTEDVRREVMALRGLGLLEPLYAASRANAASQFNNSMQSVACLTIRNKEG